MLSPQEVGDAALGQLTLGLVFVMDHLVPAAHKFLSWEEDDIDLGPIVPTEGVVKDIGVSNFSEAHYKKLAETFCVKSAVNQVELHPWLTRSELVKFFESEDVLLEAYSLLAKAAKLLDSTLTEIANQLGVSTAQVLVAYSLAKGFITLPKSVTPSRQQANFEAVNVKLSAEQVAKLDALDEYLTTGWDPIKDHAV